MDLTVTYSVCPLCEAPSGRLIGSYDACRYPHWRDPLPKLWKWLECPDCAHIYTDCYWTAGGLSILLERTHANQVAGSDPDIQRRTWFNAVDAVLARMDAPQRAFSHHASWLDVGCGDGGLVMCADEYGFAAVGLDSRPQTAAALSGLGYRTASGEFLNARVETPFDVISMADVLEHMPFPAAALRHAHGLLGQRGLLYISCPNLECSSWRAMDRAQNNPYWYELEHHHNFSRRRLMALLEQCGFAIETYGVSSRYKAGMFLIARRR